MRILKAAALMAVLGQVSAQSFIQNNSGKPLSFREIQHQFSSFSKKNDLSKAKHWKHFKRYEMDMVKHSNGRGEPDGFATYIREAVRVAEEKEAMQADVASTWFPTGPSLLPNNMLYAENGMGRINCVAFHPADTNIFYVGVAQGGLWKTTNGGQTYTPLTDHLPITRISDISLDPANPNTLYISVCDYAYIGKGLYLDGRKRHTHYGLGVYKSTDAGLSWSATGLTFQLTDGDASLIRKIVVSPDNSQHVLACGVSGMYKSLNGGATWNKLLDSLFWDMEADPVHDSVIYAATGWVENANLGHAAIYKSTDFGNTWAMLNTGIPQQGIVQRIKLAISPSDPDYVYALACDDKDGFYAIYQSTNAGSTWAFKPGSLNILEWDDGTSSGGQGTYDLALCVSSTDKNLIYTGGVNIWSSADGGSTFNPCTHWTYVNGWNTIHADIHAIQQQPHSGKYFVSCDGGLYRTSQIKPGTWGSPWTTVWENLSSGMQITSFYKLSGSRNLSDLLIAGSQDNSTVFYDGFSWNTLFGGDGMDNYIDPLNNMVLLGSSQYGTFYYSSNGGASANVVPTNPNFEASEWTTPLVADYQTPGVLYIGNENVVKSADGGFSWSPLTSIASNTTTGQSTEISALAVSPANPNRIYAARRVRHELNMKGVVITSSDGGATFSNITSNLPDTLYFTAIEANPVNFNEAVICMSGFAAGQKVFKTTNAGASWSNISFNLPNVPVNAIKYVKQTGKLVAGTDLGVYVLNSNATSWTNYSNGLPNVIISDIEINESTDKTYISTFGRGIWETSLSLLDAMQPPVGISSPAASTLQFKVYPSAGNGDLTIETTELQNCELNVIDVLGRIVLSKQVMEKSSNVSLALPPGAYYFRLSTKNSYGVRKIVIQ